MAGRLAVALGNEDQRRCVAAEARAVPCTPKAAGSAMASGSTRVAGGRAVRCILHGEGPAGDQASRRARHAA